jgi:polyisoprenoid-binding protein YceI
VSKYYKISEELLRDLLYSEELLDIIENALPTGLEGFDEDVTQPEDFDLSDYPEIIGEIL